MIRLEFEKLKSTIYPAYLHVGDYSIALEPEIIAALKKIAFPESDTFLKSVTQIIEIGHLAPRGGNRYIKELIECGIFASEEKTALSKKLYGQIQSL
ncbi:MAG: hypothetical protein AAB317_01680 [Nitrospirota bacterium]